MENLMRITAESRKGTGKIFAKKLRRDGKIPAIIYGENKEAMPVTMLRNDLKSILKAEKGANTVLKISSDEIEVDAMIKEIQYDYLSETIIHADLIRIDVNKPVFISIPVIIKGEPIGVKLEDGVFEFITREIKVKCLPTQIPNEFIVDVSNMHSGNTLKAENLELGEGIKLVEPNKVICAVISKGKEDEPRHGGADSDAKK